MTGKGRKVGTVGWSPFRAVCLALVLGLGPACAATTPTPPPPEETLVVLNAGGGSLTLLPITHPGPPTSMPLDPGILPTALATRGVRALVTSETGNQVVVLDLAVEMPERTLVLEHTPGNGVIFNDSMAYVVAPLANLATRIHLGTGDTASVSIGQTPVAAAVARGRVFVLNSNVALPCAGPTPCVLGESWLTVIDPDRNLVIDSIGLPGPGNGKALLAGGDGLLYSLDAGDGTQPGRLTVVDPVTRTELGSFGGFGILPESLAGDGRERLFVISVSEGLMEFNTRTRRVVRGAGSGIPLQDARAAAVDGDGQIYAVESGGCTFPGVGRIRVFRPDLTESRIVPAGLCSTAAGIVRLPPAGN